MFLLHSLLVQEAGCIKTLKPGGKEPWGSLLIICEATHPRKSLQGPAQGTREALALPVPDSDTHPSAYFQVRQFYR